MKIRPIRSEVGFATPPAVRAPMDLMNAQYAGMGQFARSVDVSGDIFAQVQYRKKIAEEDIKWQNQVADTKVALAEEYNKITKLPYDQIEPYAKNVLATFQERTTKYANNISDRYAQKWNAAWADLRSSFAIDTAQLETEKLRQDSIAGALKLSTALEDEAVRAYQEDDMERLESINKLMTMAYDNLRDNFGVPASQVQNWIDGFKTQSLARYKALKTEARLEQARIDAANEKAHKEQLENNYSDVLVQYSEGRLTQGQVRSMLATRQLDPDKGKVLIDALKQDAKSGGAESRKDDPIIAGELSLRVGRGDLTVVEDIRANVANLSTATYKALMKSAGDQDAQYAWKMFGIVTQRGAFDQYSPDINLRNKEYMENMVIAINNGESPTKALNNVVNQNFADVTRTNRMLGTPKFLDGAKDDLIALKYAANETVARFRLQQISPEEFNFEMRLIDNLMKNAEDKQYNQSVSSEVRERLNRNR